MVLCTDTASLVGSDINWARTSGLYSRKTGLEAGMYKRHSLQPNAISSPACEGRWMGWVGKDQDVEYS